jgi:hypothetical protein
MGVALPTPSPSTAVYVSSYGFAPRTGVPLTTSPFTAICVLIRVCLSLLLLYMGPDTGVPQAVYLPL